MKKSLLTSLILAIAIFYSCKKPHTLQEKGFSVNPDANTTSSDSAQILKNDTSIFETQPSDVLMTGNPQIRLTTIYKVNYNERTKERYIGGNSFHSNYSEESTSNGNQWNYNYMPGFTAIYGFNLVNISIFNTEQKVTKELFDKPVLIKTLYYPSFSNDTLNRKPVKRNVMFTSVYDEDTNKDGFVNLKDLRRFYSFDINGSNKQALIPANHSAYKSTYDSGNDFMYIFAKEDKNNNGRIEETEPIHIYVVDFKNPGVSSKMY